MVLILHPLRGCGEREFVYDVYEFWHGQNSTSCPFESFVAKKNVRCTPLSALQYLPQEGGDWSGEDVFQVFVLANHPHLVISVIARCNNLC